MTEVGRLLADNKAYAAARANVTDPRPSRRLAVVTCMDARIDVFAALGLHLGEVHVIRNAGGRVTDDVLRSLTLSSLLRSEPMRVRAVDAELTIAAARFIAVHPACGRESLCGGRLRRRVLVAPELEQVVGPADQFPLACARVEPSAHEPSSVASVFDLPESRLDRDSPQHGHVLAARCGHPFVHRDDEMIGLRSRCEPVFAGLAPTAVFRDGDEQLGCAGDGTVNVLGSPIASIRHQGRRRVTDTRSGGGRRDCVEHGLELFDVVDGLGDLCGDDDLAAGADDLGVVALTRPALAAQEPTVRIRDVRFGVRLGCLVASVGAGTSELAIL